MPITIKNYKGRLNKADFRREVVFVVNLYMVFSKNERGKKIKEIFDKGIERLYRAGKLEKLYHKYHEPYPDFDIQ